MDRDHRRWGVYFKSWRTLRWYLLLLLPVLLSAGTAYFKGSGLGKAVALFLFSAMLAAILFVDLCSGMSVSNWGTFNRRQHPVEYWLGVGWVAAFYLLFGTFPYWGNP